MAKLQIAAIIVIAITITIASLYYMGFFGELQASPANTTPSQTALTPARKLEGTWKTTVPVKFYIKTDFDTGELQDIGSENRTMT
jgi:FlaG/FlaF family flagellin (archaellin)